MSGIGDASATWVAAAATIVVLGGMFGERRAFGLAQHLLAGLATGYLAVLALREVLVPRLLSPLTEASSPRFDLWIGLLAVGLTVGAPWLPRRVAALPLAVMIGSLAAFALGGAIVGTVLPQAAAAMPTPADNVVIGLGGLVVTSLVLLSFLHGSPRARLVALGAAGGRWLLIAGIGAWLGYLLVTRLALLVDRIGFLLLDWIGIGR